ncbi:MAG TPA: 23S rRNA (guanosine(2251)-2'-O)-methyltransferase RlmB [Gammaproteobacteria bacterium]|jgi:23S rRNA (guanosine2251-2'-O)-methyltransferase|nr:23S rRNA (guanosine(2251)-2'-O)-methyltransferase RlmB [Gammaproteobacteria bacterium]
MKELELIYGLHTVTAVLEGGGQVHALWMLDSRHDDRLNKVAALAEKAGVKVMRVPRAELDRITDGARHQGVAAQAEGAELRDEGGIGPLLDGLKEPPFLLVLDGVQDPHNLGACLRSANAAGVHAVIAPRDKSAGLTAVARKVASGAAEATPFFQVTNLARTLRELKDRNIWFVGLAGEADQTLYELDLKGPLAIVMGAEGEGMRRLTKEHCDFLAKIPMDGSVESLNVSVATGVALFEATRQRRAKR